MRVSEVHKAQHFDLLLQTSLYSYVIKVAIRLQSYQSYIQDFCTGFGKYRPLFLTKGYETIYTRNL